MRFGWVLLTLALFSGCGSNGACLSAGPAPPPECPKGVFLDVEIADPICLDRLTGLLLCREGAGVCYLCSGPQFDDGCVVKGGIGYECVRSCAKC